MITFEYKKSILLLCILAIASFAFLSAPACAYYETWDKALTTQDVNPDTFVIKYDTNRDYNEDSGFVITWNEGAEPIGWISLKDTRKVMSIYSPTPDTYEYSYYDSYIQVPAEWEIVEDRGSEEPGKLVLKLPDGIKLNDAIKKYASLEKDGILYAKPDYLPIDINDPRYAPAILAAYPQDRLYIVYECGFEERLPWEVIYEHEQDPNIKHDNPYALVKLPENMTLEEAIYEAAIFCERQGSYCNTIPSLELLRDAEKKQYIMGGVVPDRIEVCYRKNSPHSISWEINNEFGWKNIYIYKIPQNMTLNEAISYCGSLDEVLYVKLIKYITPTSSVDGGSDLYTSIPTQTVVPSVSLVPTLSIPEKNSNPISPIPITGLVFGLCCALTVVLKRKS